MLTVVHDDDASNAGVADGGRSLIDEIVREGARQMLAAALAAEVAAYIDQFADQLDERGHRLVVRNGFHNERDVLTAAGSITVKAPRVNDKRVDPDTGKRHRFSSAIQPVWSSSGRLWVGLVVEYGQRPAPAGQFAGDRGVGHHGAFLAGIEAFPAAVQAPVGGLAASAGGRAGGCPASP
jgi:Transposase, Mutator family